MPKAKRPEPASRPLLPHNERAYELLRDKLTTLAYKPGEYLNIATVMDDLEVGRTPINHALHRLASEGLVHILPRKGVMVAPLSIDGALELIEVRLANEALCVRLAAERVTSAQLKGLMATIDTFDAAAAGHDLLQAMEFDRQFHEQIANASANAILMDILKVLYARSQRFWTVSFGREGHLREISAEHRSIVAALENRDPSAAVRAIESHILSFRSTLLRGR